MSKIELIHGDSLQSMRLMKDNEFDVAIVDPPYGIGMDGGNGGYKGFNNFEKKGWDTSIPPREYFDELFRVSKNQIIWGGNYFLDYLGATRCFLIWDKQNGTNSMADAELAWTSFDTSVRMYRGHIFKGIGNTNYNSIHPTQKPVKLYEWIIDKYTNEGDLILDTHLGSGSIAIACHYMKRNLVAYEIDKDYYDAACKRFKEQTAQMAIW